MSAYARLKRYRERKSFEREMAYLAKDWAALAQTRRPGLRGSAPHASAGLFTTTDRCRNGSLGFRFLQESLVIGLVRRNANAITRSVIGYLTVPLCCPTPDHLLNPTSRAAI